MSAVIDNLRVTGSDCALDRMTHRAELAAAAYRELRAEFLAAVEVGDASADIRTPGYGYDSPLSQVLCDDLFGDDEGSSALVTLLRDAARGEDVRLRATLLLSGVAERHARFHETDAMEEAA